MTGGPSSVFSPLGSERWLLAISRLSSSDSLDGGLRPNSNANGSSRPTPSPSGPGGDWSNPLGANHRAVVEPRNAYLIGLRGDRVCSCCVAWLAEEGPTRLLPVDSGFRSDAHRLSRIEQGALASIHAVAHPLPGYSGRVPMTGSRVLSRRCRPFPQLVPEYLLRLHWRVRPPDVQRACLPTVGSRCVACGLVHRVSALGNPMDSERRDSAQPQASRFGAGR